MIRRLALVDAPLWRQIRLQALATDPAAFSSTYEDWATRPMADFKAHLENASIFVAEEGALPLGCARLEADDDPANTRRGWVMSVFVVPEARGRGLGLALLDAICAAGRADDMTELFLDVGKANTAARTLYARTGFQDVPADQRPEGSDSGCELTMRLSL